MSEPFKQRKISVEEYLAFEESSQLRHEYVRGRMFAMTGSSDAHNRINGNLFAFLHSRLENSSCCAYMCDMKLHVESANCFYYPDILVSCEPSEAHAHVKTKPILVVEVLSPSSKGIDRREKLEAYQEIENLKYYLIVHQDRQLVELHSRSEEEDWQTRLLRTNESLDFQLPCGIEIKLPVSYLYRDVELPPRVEEDEAEYEFVHCH